MNEAMCACLNVKHKLKPTSSVRRKIGDDRRVCTQCGAEFVRKPKEKKLRTYFISVVSGLPSGSARYTDFYFDFEGPLTKSGLEKAREEAEHLLDLTNPVILNVTELAKKA
jgi:hypothetical protein